MAAIHSRLGTRTWGGAAAIALLAAVLLLALPTIALGGPAMPAFAGFVMDTDTGLGIPGAAVEAQIYDVDTGAYYYDWTNAGDVGDYALYPGGPAGTYDIEAYAGGYISDGWQTADYDGLATTVKDFSLRPKPLQFEGKVTNAQNGAFIGGAYVTATIDDAESGYTYEYYMWSSYSDGSYKLFGDGIVGDYTLRATMGRYADSEAIAAYDGTAATTKNFALQLHPVTIQGAVKNADTGTGIFNARVVAGYDDAGTGLSYSDYYYTGSSGAYELRTGGPAADYTVTASADRFYDTEATVAYNGTAAAVKDFSLTPRPAAFKGVVSDSDTLETLGWAYVSAYYYDELSGYVYSDYGYTDYDGSYALYPAPHTETFTYEVNAECGGYTSQMVALDFDGTNTVTKDFELVRYPVAVQGTVREDPTGANIEAQVDATFYDAESGNTYSDYYGTDETGEYTLRPGGPAGDYTVTASSDTYFTGEATVAYNGIDPTTKDFSLKRMPVAFQGTVTDASTGDPIGSARVEARYSDGMALDFYDVCYTHDDDGSYELYPGTHASTFTYSLKATRSGYFKQTDELEFDGSNPVAKNWVLERYPVAFTGTVTDAGTVESIEGADVEAFFEDPESGVQYSDWDDTDYFGQYELYPGVAGTYSVWAGKRGYDGQQADVSFDGVTATTKNFSLQRLPVAFSGKVTDAGTGLGLRAFVSASLDGAESHMSYFDYYYTEQDGEYWLRPGGPAGTYELWAQASRHEGSSAGVAYNGTTPTTKNFALESNPLAVRGVVSDAGTTKPISDAWVEAEGYDPETGADYFDWFETGADGSYALRPGPAMTYAVRAGKYRYVSASADVAFDGTAPVTQDFALEPWPVAFEGTVTDADTEQQLAGAYVWAEIYDAETDQWYWDETDTGLDGSYKLRPNGPAGVHTVGARLNGYEDASADVAYDGVGATVQDFALQPKLIAFQGVVSSTAGGVVQDAWVWASYEDVATESYYFDYTKTGADGAYKLRPGGPAATYVVGADKNGFASSWAPVVYDGVSAATQDFELDPYALAFKGVVTNAANSATVASASVSAYFTDPETYTEYWDEMETAANGAYALRPGPAATYQVEASLDGFVGQSVDLEFDGTTAVVKDFALAPVNGDAFEVDNVAASAKAIALGAPQAHTIFPAGDVDWVTFTAQAGVNYIIYGNDAPGSGFERTLELFENDGITRIKSGWGDISWTPNVSKQVRLKVRGYGASDVGAYTLGVRSDLAPVADADEYSVAQDTVLDVESPGVLLNDVDADGDTLFMYDVSDGVDHGTLDYSEAGGFTYTPNAGYVGADSFTYAVDDGWGFSDTAVVTINVLPIEDTPVNDAPAAFDDAGTVAEDGTLNVNGNGVLGNDVDPDGDAMTATKVSDPAKGTLTFNADGSYVYKPAANFHGTDVFTYKAKDLAGLESETATVTITVTPVNDAPTAVADTGVTTEDVTLTGNVLTNDTDIELQVLTAQKVSGPAHGTLVLNDNGSYSYTPAKDFSGADSFTYKAKDSGGKYSGVVTVSITVAEATDPTTLVLTSADKTLSVYGASYTLTGRLTAVENGAGLGGRSVVIQSSSTRTGVFTDTLTVAVTAADGSFQVALKPPATTYYRVRFSGDAPAAGPYNASQSAAAVRVTPQASVGTPVAPATMYTTKAAKVYGSLKARHTAGTYPVRIYKWRYVSGKWKPMGYVKAKASNYSDYSRYSASVKLAYKGKWKLKAYHVADAGHPAKWSAKVDYVTVK